MLRMVLIYQSNFSSKSSATVFHTKAGIPGIPGIPQIQQDYVMWTAAENHGSFITCYILQIRSLQNETLSKTNNSNIWVTVHQGPCNTSVCSWHYGDLQGIYHFRVCSRCSLNKNKQRGNPTTFPVSYHPDLELAHLRGMRTAVIQTNVWYSSSYLPTQLELESLPIFPRDQLTLMSFLGSGAFGEVFEGVAKDIMAPGTGDLKVAVKTLRKGATDLEKSEFLKEACLMSHFDHPHIIKLWGVCLQNEPQFLLLELMEGKDLLSFLRGARGTPDPLLGIGDLIAICIDVARGCAYLEKMHFVHRDLAARNCLVSVKEYTSRSRKVKIGDFGLARDIYKNDYYRKEGESLLPVRWMSPESLIDGVFTNQSDVWSFGVLMWEVMTLGQQPYPARTNLEVLHFVRSGGRLERPCNCPDDIYQLMLKCWTSEPYKRPSFWFIDSCLEHLEKMSTDIPGALGYYNDSYREYDISQGIVNQAFEERMTIDFSSPDFPGILSHHAVLL
ncbi:proto-oncogene tyrosine-protein kinase ROS-like [Dromiciops gliroides]|uniref:proto-oncogene tyrosine-protein kinase ROS-like n=1 Tax=Dromiciops gliroides TaxID=33562 RepID=UPI001CC4CC59|nr:proto-oncogene tyrosine-protein kinase ROS-like [Dromiciops gliroides]